MSGSPSLEFFYDCSSPWTYFAFTRIIPMAQELDVPIRWRPHLVGGVFNAVNQEVYAARQAMFDGENTRRLDYYIKDLADWARLCGVEANMPPGHPISSVKAMRGAFFAEEQGKIVPYSKAVFETYWSGDNPDISNDEVLLGIVDAVGIEADGFFRAINDQHYKDLLRANTEELIARGGYGSPTIYINTDDMYFGNDRLPLVEAVLRRLL
ncbi:MAG: 2-hydroxychromene-2-carboxylate isomerase [Halioglobus sp.]